MCYIIRKVSLHFWQYKTANCFQAFPQEQLRLSVNMISVIKNDKNTMSRMRHRSTTYRSNVRFRLFIFECKSVVTGGDDHERTCRRTTHSTSHPWLPVLFPTCIPLLALRIDPAWINSFKMFSSTQIVRCEYNKQVTQGKRALCVYHM